MKISGVPMEPIGEPKVESDDYGTENGGYGLKTTTTVYDTGKVYRSRRVLVTIAVSELTSSKATNVYRTVTSHYVQLEGEPAWIGAFNLLERALRFYDGAIEAERRESLAMAG